MAETHKAVKVFQDVNDEDGRLENLGYEQGTSNDTSFWLNAVWDHNDPLVHFLCS